MYFTQDDYLKIQKWISRNSVRDTEFQEADTPLRGNETVALVQNGHNRKILISDLVDQIFTLGTTDFLNVSEFSKQYKITLEEAIILVPPKSRKEGQVISFKSEEDKWEIYQFTGNVNQWTSIDLWKSFLADISEGSITLEHLSQEVKNAINSGGGVGEIVDGSIDTDKLANYAVTEQKLSPESVTEEKLSNELKSKINNLETAKIEVPTYSGDKGLPIEIIDAKASGSLFRPYAPSEYDVTGSGSTEQGSATICYSNDYSVEGKVVVLKNNMSDGHGDYMDSFAFVFPTGGVYGESETSHEIYYGKDLILKQSKQDTSEGIKPLSSYVNDGSTLYRDIYDNKYYKMLNNNKLTENYFMETVSIQEALNTIYSKIGMI